MGGVVNKPNSNLIGTIATDVILLGTWITWIVRNAILVNA